MIRPLLAGAALALALLSAASAGGYGEPRFSHHHPRPLPPEIAYRDEAFGPGFGHGPALVDVGLPRSLALPLYNEPPPRFPEF